MKPKQRKQERIKLSTKNQPIPVQRRMLQQTQ